MRRAARAAAPTSPTSPTRPRPQEIGFIPATPGYYHGEGAHVVTLDTPQFTGRPARGQRRGLLQRRDTPPDVDVSRRRLRPLRRHRSRATRGRSCRTPATRRRRRLARARPDHGASPTPTTASSSGRTARAPSWSASTTSSSHDVDIFDITDPANPEFIADFDLVELAANQLTSSALARTARTSSTTTWWSSGRQPDARCSSPTGTPATCSST